MERNFKLYRAASHLIESAKYIRGIDEELRSDILVHAECLLSQIVVDEEEIRKVENYGKIIRDELVKDDVDRTNNNSSV